MATQKEFDVDKFVKINAQAAKEGHGMKWIAEQLGYTEAYVQQKRTKLRGEGIPLPNLTKGIRSSTLTQEKIDNANKLLAQVMGQDIKDVKKQGAELVKKAQERAKERQTQSA